MTMRLPLLQRHKNRNEQRLHHREQRAGFVCASSSSTQRDMKQPNDEKSAAR
jgi:hypothetical protein